MGPQVCRNGQVLAERFISNVLGPLAPTRGRQPFLLQALYVKAELTFVEPSSMPGALTFQLTEYS